MFGKKEEALRLVLYTRPGCHLCEEMKAEISRARLGGSCTLEEVDIDSDPALVQRHGRSIPVLEIDGRPAFKGRCTAEELRRKVERARRARETA
jgi:glutaredoxin